MSTIKNWIAFLFLLLVLSNLGCKKNRSNPGPTIEEPKTVSLIDGLPFDADKLSYRSSANGIFMSLSDGATNIFIQTSSSNDGRYQVCASESCTASNNNAQITLEKSNSLYQATAGFITIKKETDGFSIAYEFDARNGSQISSVKQGYALFASGYNLNPTICDLRQQDSDASLSDFTLDHYEVVDGQIVKITYIYHYGSRNSVITTHFRGHSTLEYEVNGVLRKATSFDENGKIYAYIEFIQETVHDQIPRIIRADEYVPITYRPNEVPIEGPEYRLNSSWNYEYDMMGRIAKQTEYSFYTGQKTYAGYNRYIYDGRGNLMSIYEKGDDPGGMEYLEVEFPEYDDANNYLSGNATLQFIYKNYSNNNFTKVKEGNDIIQDIRWEYNDRNYPTKMIYPKGYYRTFSYECYRLQ